MSIVHIVGAGMAGLAAAVRLTQRGRRVVIYDQADHAGGRCRSYLDGVLGRRIDNGNHLLLSANDAALDYLATIGAGDSLVGPAHAAFPFVDLETGRRWQAEFSDGPLLGRIPLPPRGIPDVTLRQVVGGLALRNAGPDTTVTNCLDTTSALYRRFWQPLAVAALNTECEAAAARLLWPVVAETVLRGGAKCRPLVARVGLSESFVEPALYWLAARGALLNLGWRLRGLAFDGDRVAALDFAGDRRIAVDGPVIVALPPASAQRVVPGLAAPKDSRAIVNGHFVVSGGLPRLPHDSPLIGVLGGTAEWLFLRGDVVSVTISAADRLLDLDDGEIARRMWSDITRALRLAGSATSLPAHRIVKEKRATFAQTPAALPLRAGTRTRWHNLFLAGDWTDTGLPATIEGAIRSGNTAARAVA